MTHSLLSVIGVIGLFRSGRTQVPFSLELASCLSRNDVIKDGAVNRSFSPGVMCEMKSPLL